MVRRSEGHGIKIERPRSEVQTPKSEVYRVVALCVIEFLPLRLLRSSDETHLIKVSVKSEGFFDSHLPHNHETDAVSKAEILIIIRFKQIERFLLNLSKRVSS